MRRGRVHYVTLRSTETVLSSSSRRDAHQQRIPRALHIQLDAHGNLDWSQFNGDSTSILESRTAPKCHHDARARSDIARLIRTLTLRNITPWRFRDDQPRRFRLLAAHDFHSHNLTIIEQGGYLIFMPAAKC